MGVRYLCQSPDFSWPADVLARAGSAIFPPAAKAGAHCADLEMTARGPAKKLLPMSAWSGTASSGRRCRTLTARLSLRTLRSSRSEAGQADADMFIAF
jgi:hypothetical protein